MRENRDKWGNWLPEVAQARRAASRLAEAGRMPVTWVKRMGRGGRVHVKGSASKRRRKIAELQLEAGPLPLVSEAQWRAAMERNDPKVRDTHPHVARRWRREKIWQAIERIRRGEAA